MRLIDADELLIDARLGDDEIPYISAEQIENAPTVEVEPIVRCKECIYRYTNDCAMSTLDTDAYNDYFIREWTIDEGFCQRRAKMEGENEND